MKKHIIYILSTFLFLVYSSNFGYSQDSHTDDRDHVASGHEHSNEVSLAFGIVPLPEENTTTVGLHFHYIKGIGEKKRFGIGVGLETIFDEHKHYTVSTVFQYRIYKGLILAYAPGVLFLLEGSELENKTQFAQHIEMTYEFEIGEFHIGPVIEVGIEQEGVHYMGGVHFGVEF